MSKVIKFSLLLILEYAFFFSLLYFLYIVPWKIKCKNAQKVLQDVSEKNIKIIIGITHTASLLANFMVDLFLFIPFVVAAEFAVAGNFKFRKYTIFSSQEQALFLFLIPITAIVFLVYAFYYISCKTEKYLFSWIYKEWHWDSKKISIDELYKNIEKSNKSVMIYYVLCYVAIGLLMTMLAPAFLWTLNSVENPSITAFH